MPLAKVTLDSLAAHLAAFPAHEVEIVDRTDPRKPVTRTARLLFTLDGGHPVARHSWADIWQPVAAAAGLPPRTGLHALRHLYASLLIEHGESVKTVQRRLGHSSAAVTLDTYTHLWPDSDDQTRKAVELRYRGATPACFEHTFEYRGVGAWWQEFGSGGRGRSRSAGTAWVQRTSLNVANGRRRTRSKMTGQMRYGGNPPRSATHLVQFADDR
ncbi:MAG: tyrosine-type recombinase/integrase [Pseudonocardiaceae bacterium]